MAGSYSIKIVFKTINEMTGPMQEIDAQAKKLSRSVKSMYYGMEKATEGFGKSLRKLGGEIGKNLGIDKLFSVSTVVDFMKSGLKSAIEYQTALAKIGTVADATAVPLDALSKSIIDISTKTSVASGKIADSMYKAITAGIPTAKAAAFVETATKAAIGGFSDEATVIDGLTSVLNAYGLQAEYATKITDQMLLAQNLGKTSFNEMAGSISTVIPYASHLGMATEELFASIATLTGSGMKTTDAMTSMRGAFTSVLHPSREAAEIARQLGIDFSASALQAKGFTKFIDEISRAAKGNQSVIAKLFGSDKADAAIRILTSSGAEAFSDNLAAMQESAGTATAAFEKMMDTPEKRWAKAMNTIKNAGINLGNSLLPVAEKVIEKISGIADKFAQFDFSRVTAIFAAAFWVVDLFVSVLAGALEIAWEYRGVIILVAGALFLFVGLAKAAALIDGIRQVVLWGVALATGAHAKALEIANKKTIAYNALQAIQTGITTAATVAQWLLNAAMAVNPIYWLIGGFVLLVVAIKAGLKWGHKITMFFGGPLISMIVEVIKHFGFIKEAFAAGDILEGIKRIGMVLLSGLIAPMQGFLELLAKIPGLDKHLGPAVAKIQELRNKLTGVEPPDTEPPDTEPPDELEKGLTPPGFDLPDFDMPDFGSGGSAGRSKLHGVVDISGGAFAGNGAYTANSAVNAITAAPVSTETVMARHVMEIAVTLKNIERGIVEIARSPVLTATSMRPRADGGGNPPDFDSPRSIGPVTQAERMAYNVEERIQRIIIEVAAERGTAARVVRAPRDAQIELTASGGNL
jgi:TP901 family phage tail tape measure protein